MGRMGASYWLWVRAFEWFESLTTNGTGCWRHVRGPFECLRADGNGANGGAEIPVFTAMTSWGGGMAEGWRGTAGDGGDGGDGGRGAGCEIRALAGNGSLDYINGPEPSLTADNVNGRGPSFTADYIDGLEPSFDADYTNGRGPSFDAARKAPCYTQPGPTRRLMEGFHAQAVRGQ